MQFYHSKDIKTFEAHPLQFTVWRYSGKSRIIVEFFATIMLAIAIHIFVNFVIRDAPSVKLIMEKFLLMENIYLNTNSSMPGYTEIEK